MRSGTSRALCSCRITERGDEVGGGTPEQLAKMTRYYFDLWRDIVKANDIRAE
jgi:hypothetical protein